MTNKTKEDEGLKDNLKYIGLDLEEIPESLLSNSKINYKPLKNYDDTNYKVYKYVDIKDIDILITPRDRLDDLNEKYKEAQPLFEYMDSDSEENIENYTAFLNMIKNLDIEKIEEIEHEQKMLNKKIPYEIKYKNDFKWQIYYSDVEDKYFMLFSSNENNTETLFYLIKKKIQAKKGKKKEMIYVPISHEDYSNKLLRKSQIADLENYLWFFTKDWASIYEVHDQEDNTTLQIIGQTNVYEKIKSIYKISLENKKQADEQFKLIKALFILGSHNEGEYEFKTMINEEGSLDFCYNLNKITYSNLLEFIRQQVMVKQQKIDAIYNQIIVKMESLEMLKQTVKKQNEEYLIKEKQIVNFLECKKTFFGRVKYFFKGKKSKTKETIQIPKEAEQREEISKSEKIEAKELYTIEDLLKVSSSVKEEETKLKNIEMDIKALENKKVNLESKIKNATLYINEIESHKKSIFDFWKFTNKDEVSLLTQSDEKPENDNAKLKKVFDYEEDIEDFGKLMDEKQKMLLSKNECDAMFAIRNDINTFNILNKARILKRDNDAIQKKLDNLKKEYMNDYESIQDKDFDIFGGVIEDKTKIKVLKNNKHREIEKDKYKILEINPQTTIEEYKENIENYKKLLEEAYGKIETPYDISLYQAGTKELQENSFQIFNINPKSELENKNIKGEKIKLYKCNLKEKMPALFYTNIMFYDNLNKTLPSGIDIETEALLDLKKFELKLVSRKDFNINCLDGEFDNQIKQIELYEYELERAGKYNDK